MTKQSSNSDENKFSWKLIGQIVLVITAIILVLVLGWRVKSLNFLGIVIEPPSTPTTIALDENFFMGNWEAIDAFDGSNLQLTITKSEDNLYKIVLFDDKRRSQCGTNNDIPVFAYRGEGAGQVIGKILSANLTFWCLTNPPSQLNSHNINLTYDKSSDTLTDFYIGEDVPSNVWNRVK